MSQDSDPHKVERDIERGKERELEMESDRERGTEIKREKEKANGREGGGRKV